jgi:hypothetical protein
MAPTPFTADEIRAGCPAGRVIELLVEEADQPPHHRTNHFIDTDEAGATVEHTPSGATVRSTWAEMQAHASFPEAVTTIDQDTIEIPLGTLDCHRYTVRDGDTVMTFWFSPAYPGMPVRYRQEENGSVLSQTTMLSSKP